jgi:uncharacterized protein involved in outer membrane biogenesis
MRRKLLLLFIILLLAISCVIFYLNKFILPTKIKSLVINTLQEATQKKVTLEALEFNLFKGLVLKNLVLSDDTRPLVSVKEGSCTFLILPIFGKRIIFPTISLKSPLIFLERRPDNTFNLMDLFPRKPAKAKNAKFKIFVYKVKIIGGRVDFQDDTVSPVFTKSINNLNLTVYLSLPASVKFNLNFGIADAAATKISASAGFKIPTKELQAKINIQDLSVRELTDYYQNLKTLINQGKLDALINISFKNNLLGINLYGQSQDLALSKDKILAQLNANLKADVKYSLSERQLNFSGILDIVAGDISGLDFVDKVNNINGQIKFGNSGLAADKITANVFGLPVAIKLALNDFRPPLLNMNLTCALDLGAGKRILADKFRLALPADIQGAGNLSLAVQSDLTFRKPAQINGYLDITGASLKLEKVNFIAEGISGRLEFSPDQLKWEGLSFQCLGVPYKSSGTLTNFTSPQVSLGISSSGLNLDSVFAVQDKLITFSKFTGQYLNSKFSLSGNINTQNPPNLQADISGMLNAELGDLKIIFPKFKDQLVKAGPAGILGIEFDFNGNPNDFKTCALQATLSSPVISAFGLKAQGLLLNYQQADGLIDIALNNLSLYDGKAQGQVKINLKSENLPYWASLNILGLKLEKLKLDTAVKAKDLAGNIQAEVKLNGFTPYPDKLSGAGNISITEGNLWQLNLFAGIGELLFARDFAKIIFSAGACDFMIQDKVIFTDNLRLKSALADLGGSLRIGFDGAIDGALNVQVNDQNAPLTSTFKDIATAIIGGAGRFGVIKISGTLKEPKYKFTPAVGSIIKGLRDAIFGVPSQ